MQSIQKDENVFQTSFGDFPLHQYVLKHGNNEWQIKHVSSVLSKAEENQFLRDRPEKLPYGIALWASSIALAHEIASSPQLFRDRKILELGSGTGLAGIVAATFKGQVVQTDRNELAMSLCRVNLRLNRVETIQQLDDWSDWHNYDRYDWIIGSDILYSEEMQPHLFKIFEGNLLPGGRILVSDPFRAVGINFLEELNEKGWQVRFNKWIISEESSTRSVGVFELEPPSR